MDKLLYSGEIDKAITEIYKVIEKIGIY